MATFETLPPRDLSELSREELCKLGRMIPIYSLVLLEIDGIPVHCHLLNRSDWDGSISGGPLTQVAPGGRQLGLGQIIAGSQGVNYYRNIVDIMIPEDKMEAGLRGILGNTGS